MTNKTTDARVARRVPLGLHADLSFGGETFSLPVKNLSLSGACLEADREFPIGEVCRLSISLDGDDDPQQCLIDARIVRNGTGEIGVALVQIIGIESYEHLRNLLLYNAAEPNEIAEELEVVRGLPSANSQR